MHTLDLKNNQITGFDKLLLTSGNQILENLIVSENSIQSISNYVSPELIELHMADCDISSLQNVVFNAKMVDLSGNDLKRMQRVTFQNVSYVLMKNCGISLETIDKLNMTFIPLPAHDPFIDMSGNDITVSGLKQINYKLPKGVNYIKTDDGKYCGCWLNCL